MQALLTAGAALGHCDAVGTTPLMAAAQGGHVAVCTALITPSEEEGAPKPNLDATDENGWAALHHAAMNGHLPVAELLCEHGCNLDALETRGSRGLEQFDSAIAARVEIVRAERAAKAAAEAAAAEEGDGE